MQYTRQAVVRITPPEDEWLRQRAERGDRSIAKVIRELIQEAMRSEEQHQHQAA